MFRYQRLGIKIQRITYNCHSCQALRKKVLLILLLNLFVRPIQTKKKLYKCIAAAMQAER